MKSKKDKKLQRAFDNMSARITRATGSSAAFAVAAFIIIIWLITGPIFHYSDTWQLIINTGTTIVTFLMVFIIQHSQNKDTVAMQLKLNELIAANSVASNRLVDIEDLTEEELEAIKKFYVKLAKLSKKEKDIFASHSIDEAQSRHETKKEVAKNK